MCWDCFCPFRQNTADRLWTGITKFFKLNLWSCCTSRIDLCVESGSSCTMKLSLMSEINTQSTGSSICDGGNQGKEEVKNGFMHLWARVKMSPRLGTCLVFFYFVLKKMEVWEEAIIPSRNIWSSPKSQARWINCCAVYVCDRARRTSKTTP